MQHPEMEHSGARATLSAVSSWAVKVVNNQQRLQGMVGARWQESFYGEAIPLLEMVAACLNFPALSRKPSASGVF